MNGGRNLANFNWLDVKTVLGTCDGVFIPLGSTEQHGYHLPLNTDTLICERVVQRVCELKNLYYVPIIPYTQTWSSSDYSGTIHIAENKIIDYVIDVVASLEKCNPKKIIIYSFHQGNVHVIKQVLRYFYKKHANIFYVQTNDLLGKCKDIVRNIRCGVWHASEIETSLMLYLHTDSVNKAHYIDFDPDTVPHNTETKWNEFNVFGSYGNLHDSSKEKGEQIFSIIIEDLLKQLDGLYASEQKIDIRLFATDLDGTLLNTAKELSEDTKSALRTLHDTAKICFVSGRYEKMMMPYIDSVQICDYSISCNGAFIRNCTTNEIVYKKTVEAQAAKKIVSMIDGEGYMYVIYTENRIYYKQNLLKAKEKIRYAQEYYQKNKNETIEAVEIVRDISSIEYDAILKIAVYEINDIDGLVKRLPNASVCFEQTGDRLLCIFAADVSKGNAVRVLQSILHCPQKQTMVCGDYINDLSMFAFADYKVAVANALPEVLAKANSIVASNDENGIANIINEKLIQRSIEKS